MLRKNKIGIWKNTSQQDLIKTFDFKHSWAVPTENTGSAIPFFISRILETLDPWESCSLWKANGYWGLYINETSLPHHKVWARILQKLGIPSYFKGAVIFNRNELTDLLSVSFVQIAFAWSVADDLYLIPDHGQQIIKTDHHGFVEVSFLDKNRLEKFTAELAKSKIFPSEQ